jgi:hypothetical protein
MFMAGETEKKGSPQTWVFLCFWILFKQIYIFYNKHMFYSHYITILFKNRDLSIRATWFNFEKHIN